MWGGKSVHENAFLNLFHRLDQAANFWAMPALYLTDKAVSGSILNKTLKMWVSLLFQIWSSP